MCNRFQSLRRCETRGELAEEPTGCAVHRVWSGGDVGRRSEFETKPRPRPRRQRAPSAFLAARKFLTTQTTHCSAHAISRVRGSRNRACTRRKARRNLSTERGDRSRLRSVCVRMRSCWSAAPCMRDMRGREQSSICAHTSFALGGCAQMRSVALGCAQKCWTRGVPYETVLRPMFGC